MLVFATRIWMSRSMAEENESSGGSRYSLSGFMKLEALVIAGATLLLYLQGLLYVEAFCAGLGIAREHFNLTFSEIPPNDVRLRDGMPALTNAFTYTRFREFSRRKPEEDDLDPVAHLLPRRETGRVGQAAEREHRSEE